MSSAEIHRRFRYHPPTVDRAKVHEAIREDFWDIAATMEACLVESREKALCLTKLEEAMFWANACVARNSGAAAVSSTHTGSDPGQDEQPVS